MQNNRIQPSIGELHDYDEQVHPTCSLCPFFERHYRGDAWKASSSSHSLPINGFVNPTAFSTKAGTGLGKQSVVVRLPSLAVVHVSCLHQILEQYGIPVLVFGQLGV